MPNKYSASEFIKTVYSLLITRITYSEARLIRRPIYIRGRKSIVGGSGLTTGRFCRFDLDGAKQTLYIGKNCEMGDMTHIVALNKVSIGDDVLIASKCFISDTDHGCYKGINQDSAIVPPNRRKLVSGETIIGNNVWIGENVVILAGSSIGDGCIIGANSVVKGEIPKGTIIAGSPAKVIKKWDADSGKWIKI